MSNYFTETDLKKILLEVHTQPMLVMALKRRQLIREMEQVKDEVVGQFITSAQLSYLKKRRAKRREPAYLKSNDVDLIRHYYSRHAHSKIKQVQSAIVHSFIAGGFRVRELCDFDVRNIDPENMRIRILGKGMKWRWTYVERGYMDFLIKFKSQYLCGSQFVCKNTYGQDYHPFFLNGKGRPFTPRNIQKFLETVSRSIDNLSIKLHPHLLRHTYGVFRVLKNPTLSIEELRQDMGHEDVRTTQIYFQLAEPERVALAKRREDGSSSLQKL
ncbi:MAG: site-specific integrase [Candidatus Latescibacteria bacterium]|nr:site-specific integrase [Candidatus Latescibacterota bacterium]